MISDRGSLDLGPSPTDAPNLPIPDAPTRSSLALGADEAATWLRRVLAGETLWGSVDKAGEWSVRPPTGGETMDACKELLKYGAALARETLPGEDPAIQEAAALDRLCLQDLMMLREIAERAYAAAASR